METGAYTATIQKSLYKEVSLPIAIPNGDRVANVKPIALAPAVEAAGTFANLLRVEELLDRKLEAPLKFKDTPLKEFAKELAARARVPIIIDQRQLAMYGLSDQVPISFDVGSLTLRDALKLALVDLDCTVTARMGSTNAVLIITTSEGAYANAERVVFPLDAFLSTKFDDKSYASLINAIQTSVRPETWATMGGASTIVAIKEQNALAVTAGFRVQCAVHGYLIDLRSVEIKEARPRR